MSQKTRFRLWKNYRAKIGVVAAAKWLFAPRGDVAVRGSHLFAEPRTRKDGAPAFFRDRVFQQPRL